MLTTEAMDERKWGQSPVLRAALTGKPDTSWDKLTSISDDSISALGRHIDIATVACRNPDALRAAARDLGWQAYHQDIEGLRDRLEHASGWLHELAREVGDLHRLAPEP